MNQTDLPPPSRPKQVLGWFVHFYTALGVIAAAGIAVLIVEGTREAFRWAFVLMLVATLIDATDGTLARAVRIKETLPGFDGRRLDDLIDYLNFAFLPIFLIWRAALLPEGQEYWLLLALLASAYGFSQAEAKTEDGYFLGFPSYWNLVAFYLYVLEPMPGWISLALVIGPALLTFVPSLYLYPTMKGRLNFVTNLLSVPWVGLMVWVLVEFPLEVTAESRGRRLAIWSLYFPIYYMTASWLVTLRRWLGPNAKPRKED